MGTCIDSAILRMLEILCCHQDYSVSQMHFSPFYFSQTNFLEQPKYIKILLTDSHFISHHFYLKHHTDSIYLYIHYTEAKRISTSLKSIHNNPSPHHHTFQRTLCEASFSNKSALLELPVRVPAWVAWWSSLGWLELYFMLCIAAKFGVLLAPGNISCLLLSSPENFRHDSEYMHNFYIFIVRFAIRHRLSLFVFFSL